VVRLLAYPQSRTRQYSTQRWLQPPVRPAPPARSTQPMVAAPRSAGVETRDAPGPIALHPPVAPGAEARTARPAATASAPTRRPRGSRSSAVGGPGARRVLTPATRAVAGRAGQPPGAGAAAAGQPPVPAATLPAPRPPVLGGSRARPGWAPGAPGPTPAPPTVVPKKPLASPSRPGSNRQRAATLPPWRPRRPGGPRGAAGSHHQHPGRRPPPLASRPSGSTASAATLPPWAPELGRGVTPGHAGPPQKPATRPVVPNRWPLPPRSGQHPPSAPPSHRWRPRWAASRGLPVAAAARARPGAAPGSHTSTRGRRRRWASRPFRQHSPAPRGGTPPSWAAELRPGRPPGCAGPQQPATRHYPARGQPSVRQHSHRFDDRSRGRARRGAAPGRAGVHTPSNAFIPGRLASRPSGPQPAPARPPSRRGGSSSGAGRGPGARRYPHQHLRLVVPAAGHPPVRQHRERAHPPAVAGRARTGAGPPPVPTPAPGRRRGRRR
jgi:hypothetical protein